MKDHKILLVGVGGQGTILASRILSWIALQQGKSIKMSEIHGMAQRGGTVTTQVCIADKVFSPVIEPGEADILLSFELLEALRNLHYLRGDGLLLVNNLRIMPMSVITGEEVYPPEIEITLGTSRANLHIISASEKAYELGNPRVANVIMLGALSKYLTDIELSVWHQALDECVPPRHIELNRLAFDAGLRLG